MRLPNNCWPPQPKTCLKRIIQVIHLLYLHDPHKNSECESWQLHQVLISLSCPTSLVSTDSLKLKGSDSIHSKTHKLHLNFSKKCFMHIDLQDSNLYLSLKVPLDSFSLERSHQILKITLDFQKLGALHIPHQFPATKRTGPSFEILVSILCLSCDISESWFDFPCQV